MIISPLPGSIQVLKGKKDMIIAKIHNGKNNTVTQYAICTDLTETREEREIIRVNSLFHAAILYRFITGAPLPDNDYYIAKEMLLNENKTSK